MRVENQKEIGQIRRKVFSGWNNYSQVEIDWIEKAKKQLKETKGIDLEKQIGYGHNLPLGKDPSFSDADILRIIYARGFNIDLIVNGLYSHLQWRQLNYPQTMLNEKSLHILKKGLFYIHGRTKDYMPILHINLSNFAEMIHSKEIDNFVFCQLHNFFAQYMINQMLVPGQVEKWLIIVNVSKYPIKDLPL